MGTMIIDKEKQIVQSIRKLELKECKFEYLKMNSDNFIKNVLNL